MENMSVFNFNSNRKIGAFLQMYGTEIMQLKLYVHKQWLVGVPVYFK